VRIRSGYRSWWSNVKVYGNRIAKAMAEQLAKGSTQYAHNWLTANGDENANNAVVMDANGYSWIDGTFTGGYDIKGPIPIP
jgi:hypothetical protein